MKLVVSFLLALVVVQAQNPASQAARQWRQQHERAIMDEFVALLAIPNIAADRANIQRNAETIAAMMQKRGIAASWYPCPAGIRWCSGKSRRRGLPQTIVFYAHYDGQPLDPKEWATPPFTPTLRDKQIENDGQVIPCRRPGKPFDPEWRLYARGAADDKAPIIAMLAAVDAIRAAGLKMKSNIKFAFEGEEEAGSANLEKTLAANKELFAGDVWFTCEGRCIRRGGSRSRLGRGGISTLISRFTARAANCTAGITGIGRLIRRWSWCNCWRR